MLGRYRSVRATCASSLRARDSLGLGQQFPGVGPAQELVMQSGERLQAKVPATTKQAHASTR